MFGGPAGGFGLLGVLPLGVPVGGGDGEEGQHVEDHRGAGSVLAPAERGPAVDEVAGRAAQVLCVAELASGVGAGEARSNSQAAWRSSLRVWSADLPDDLAQPRHPAGTGRRMGRQQRPGAAFHLRTLHHWTDH